MSSQDSLRQRLAVHWPPMAIELRTQDLLLRLPSDEDYLQLLEIISARRVHDPSTMPFNEPWTKVPSPEIEENSLRHWWARRADVQRAAWNLNFTIIHNDRAIGIQDIFAKDYATLRTVETGSWIGMDHQGRGLGKQARAAVLNFAFTQLGARYALTCAFVDNGRSQGVTKAMGYQEDGVEEKAPEGVPRTMQRYRLSRDEWAKHAAIAVTITGVTQRCLEMLGADGAVSAPALQ